DVAFTYLPDEAEDAAETSRLIEDAGRRAVAIEVDLRDEQAARDAVDSAVAALGGLEVVVSNAAYQNAQPDGLAAISTEQLDRTLKTNLYAMVWVVQQALPHLGPGATIICTSSIQAFQPSPGLLDYAMTKAATVNFVRGLALQLGPKGVRVNAVCPGPIWTPLIPATMDPDKVDSFGSDTPLGRPGQPAEMAAAYVFLASDDSSYVTGERIVATGGKLA
ncbi:MAG TPA: SDR family oxidoreductase, partial [Actinotalea sp.]|nr:SDR family oxidoreductase [Actinotalea sp.]